MRHLPFRPTERSLLFIGEGSVHGNDLPPLDGSFILRLWMRPEVDDSGGEATIFEIHAAVPDSGSSPPLRIVWDGRNSSLDVRRGEAGGIRIESLAAAWRHLALSRSGTALSAHLDGLLVGTMTDAAPLGTGSSMGAAFAAGGFFSGSLDDAVYERRPLEAEEMLSRLLEGAPAVYLTPQNAGDEVLSYPGAAIRVLELRVHTGSSDEEFRLRNLRVTGRARSGDESPDPLSLLTLFDELRLVLRAACDESAVTVGPMETTEVTPDHAVFELTEAEPFPLPSESVLCLSVEGRLASDAPIDSAVSLSVVSPDDVSIDVQWEEGGDGNGAANDAYVAGRRLSNAATVEGAGFRVVSPPAVLLRSAPDDVTGEFRPDVPLHRLVLEPDSVEDLIVESVIHRRVEGTAVDGLVEPRLFLDRDRDGDLEDHEFLEQGTIEPEDGSIRSATEPTR